ncbi:GNAT family N-acetyltransferase [Dyella sp. C9]|uniref:GNAT family N-acetyltransferase n=1 Tax=Dyella sp. C9 TaxID=2202154 RepID=UPI000DEFD45F|nr:GNAT family protein [Dyella sp. C9]
MTLNWKGAPQPDKLPLEGAYVHLVPLDIEQHAQALFEASTAEGREERFRYLAEEAPRSIEEQHQWMERAIARADPLFFAVVDKTTGRAEGRQAFMRIDTANGVIEIGHIMWGPALARTRKATEAFFLFADYAFQLGYRRLEWKCNDENAPSKRAAIRFGFSHEGLFRQHMVVKGLNRDTAWYSIIDRDWPRLRQSFQAWLEPGNFDDAGNQLHKLTLSP